jgi:hypothetical protein
MTTDNPSLIKLDGVTKVFLTDEVETHALSGIHMDIRKGDVRTARSEPVDAIAAFNFSYFLFKTRKDLVGYFRHARSQLFGFHAADIEGRLDARQAAQLTLEVPPLAGDVRR